MQGEQVVLTDMLQCRERRAQIQDTFIEQYHCPVISFCMNIPGPVKTNEQIRTAFDSGKNTLLLKLEQAEADIKNSRVKGDTRLNDAKMAEIAERRSM